MDRLEDSFNAAMMNIYHRAKKEASYTATIFHNMLLSQGGLLTARQLINAKKPSDGYTALWERSRLDLTVEALVIDNPDWWPLFEPEELERARKRLADYQYASLSSRT